MSVLDARYDRNVRMFGVDGQRKLRETSVALVGVGGLGSPVAQHLALLGVGQVTLIDYKELNQASRNRFVGARHDDPVPGSPKVTLAGRLIREINPNIEITELITGLVTKEAFDAVKAADWIIGCLDEDGPRFILNELCAAYAKPYIDLASDIPEPGIYGGRVCISCDCNGCMYCLDVIDMDDVRKYLSSDAEQDAAAAAYGVPRGTLGETGPSVSPVNGVIASLAATEFMVGITRMRVPTPLIEYRGYQSKVFVITDVPKADCYYCREIRGKRGEADVERYLKTPHLLKR